MIALFILSCQKDDFENIGPIQGNIARFKISTVSSKDIRKNKQLLKVISSIETPKKPLKNGRYVESENYSFVVDTSYGIFIKDTESNLYSYNFEIHKDTVSDNLKNLVVVFDSTEQYQSFIVDYGITKEEFSTYNFNNKPQTDSISITPLDFKIQDLGIDIAGKCSGGKIRMCRNLYLF